MRTHQASQKKSSVHKSNASTSNPLASRPFAVQQKVEESERAHQPKGYESTLSDFAILNPDGGKAMPVQFKLAIGAVGDKYEQEADRVAKQVVQRMNASQSVQLQQEQTVQRQEMPEDEEKLQMKPEFTIQRETTPNRVGTKSADRVGAVVQREKETIDASEVSNADMDVSGKKGGLDSQSTSAIKTPSGIVRGYLWPRTKQQVEEEHTKDRNVLNRFITNGLQSTDKRLENSCEWLKQGYAGVYALTLTHDSNARVIAAGQDPNKKMAFFGYSLTAGQGSDPIYKPIPINPAIGPAGSFHPNATTSYNNATNDMTNIVIQEPETGGFAHSGNMVIPQPSLFGNNKLADQITAFFANKLLKHEVQHLADEHQLTTPALVPGNYNRLVEDLVALCKTNNITPTDTEFAAMGITLDPTYGITVARPLVNPVPPPNHTINHAILNTPSVGNYLRATTDQAKETALQTILQDISSSHMTLAANKGLPGTPAQSITLNLFTNPPTGLNDPLLRIAKGAADITRISTIQERGWRSYVTELRAYSFQGNQYTDYATRTRPTAINSSTVGNVYGTNGHLINPITNQEVTDQRLFIWRKAQFDVIKNMFNAGIYPDFKEAWEYDDMYNAPNERKFQTRVHAFDKPISINPLNSVRVRNLYLAIRAIQPADAQGSPNVTALMTALGNLNPDESQQQLANPAMDEAITQYLGANQHTYNGYQLEQYVRILLSNIGKGISPYQEGNKDYNPA
jgi:hypothetical protein